MVWYCLVLVWVDLLFRLISGSSVVSGVMVVVSVVVGMRCLVSGFFFSEIFGLLKVLFIFIGVCKVSGLMFLGVMCSIRFRCLVVNERLFCICSVEFGVLMMK